MGRDVCLYIMMKNILLRTIALLTAVVAITGIDAKGQDYAECRGTATPYPAPEAREPLPDSLRLVALTHVGRHGSRFATSDKRPKHVAEYLRAANGSGRLTARGERLLSLIGKVMRQSDGHWGELDSLGAAEQRGIARRLYNAWPYLFNDTITVNAIASYVPRCVMSMDQFTHQIALSRNDLDIASLSGPSNNSLLRPFQIDSAYLSFIRLAPWKEDMEMFERETVPLDPVRRLVGEYMDTDTVGARKIAIDMFGFLAGLNASGFAGDWLEEYFTLDEARALWSIGNARQYFEHSASAYSQVPATIFRPLLSEMTEDLMLAAGGDSSCPVTLRFGHAETLMPLLSLIDAPGCRFLTTDPREVASHWRNYNVAPMAVNLQMLLCRSRGGRYYVRVDINERPVRLPGSKDIIMTLEEARSLFVKFTYNL